MVGEERARRWQAGGLERGSLLRHHVNEGDHRRHRLRVTQLISSSQPPFFSFYTHVHMNEHTLVRRDVHSQMLLARSLFKNKDGNISCANTRHMKECLHVRDTRMCCMSSRAVCMCMWMWMWMCMCMWMCMWMCELHIAS